MLNQLTVPLWLYALIALCCSAQTAHATQPNFIFIITDDQDLLMDSLMYQPKVQKHFGDEGTFYSKHFCTISVCCPSRVSLLTGKAAHNTNVTDVQAPYEGPFIVPADKLPGGYTKFISEGWNDKYLPIWLQEAGYNTYYTGKLMNGHSMSTYNNPFPAGWNGTDFLIDPGTYLYYNSTTQRNKDAPKKNPGLYSTDLVAENAIGFLDEALAAADEESFFLGIAPVGPHSETHTAVVDGLATTALYPPVPADRHKDLFPDVKVPRTKNFNSDKATSASWIRSLEKNNETVVEYMDEWYRLRLQTLQAVDDLVDTVFDWLDAHPDVRDNTYVIYTTDNGFHIGQHRMTPGKSCSIEEDVNIPFFIRGPGVAKGAVATFPTSHTDIVPTLFQLAGIPLREEFDGEPIPVTGDLVAAGKQKSEQVNIEYWGYSVVEGVFGGEGAGMYKTPQNVLAGVVGINNTYKTVRVVGEDYNLMYTVWCTNEHELYDMNNDPYQMTNLYHTNSTLASWPLSNLEPRLDALTMVLKSCSGAVCTRPWAIIHPEGGVATLKDAMHPKFDAFYGAQPRVAYTGCALGYFTGLEGPMSVEPYSSAVWGRREKWKRWI
ncbi:Uu.00g131290.m01.CDS01 [Anthostomella pinea]|uniref:Arylsulfatase n=1 Tax=Anthostomella pinea TaxID=933095 RepID=A0AAI8VIV1_9PEZI|nr:Uu.00g131290.m01.CDS01 [Anthostomella pinea]